MAISTAVGPSAISIVRLSGENILSLLQGVFMGVDLRSAPNRTLYYGKIVDPATQQKIDEVLAVYMPSESSFTREDLVEIHCHGGYWIPHRILKLFLKNGARLAEPGEFTRRAYLNGRIDLTQAEAVHELISAQNDLAQVSAFSNLERRFSKKIYAFRSNLIRVLAQLEVHIDYPEEDLEPTDEQSIRHSIRSILQSIQEILIENQNGKILREGVKLAIVGKTNVGKSSLFNYFSREDRAIVSSIHGTTRDFLENRIQILGFPIEIIDTAGLRKTHDPIEVLGKERTYQRIQDADFILWLLDQNQSWSEEDQKVREWIEGKPYILVLNKQDLKKKLQDHDLKPLEPLASFSISITSEIGLPQLEEGLIDLFMGLSKNGLTNQTITERRTWNENLIFCNTRQEDLLKKTEEPLTRALVALKEKHSYEFIALELREALDFLGEIVGAVSTEEILDEVFRNFCVGK